MAEYQKGKTYEKMYGKEKAEKINFKKREKLKGRNKGKTFEEIHGKKKAIKIKNKISKKIKGRIIGTLEERYGKEKANKIKNKISKKNKGRTIGTLEERYGKDEANKIRERYSKVRKGKTFEEIHGKEKANKIRERYSKVWTKTKIINNLNNILKKTGPVTRSNIQHLYHYYNICCEATIRKRFGSFDNLAIEASIEFKTTKGNIGSNEKQILNDIEQEEGIILLRQYSIAGCFIDGYDRENNIAYEVDEVHHKYQKIEDIIREDKIKEVLGCEFIRVRG